MKMRVAHMTMQQTARQVCLHALLECCVSAHACASSKHIAPETAREGCTFHVTQPGHAGVFPTDRRVIGNVCVSACERACSPCGIIIAVAVVIIITHRTHQTGLNTRSMSSGGAAALFAFWCLAWPDSNRARQSRTFAHRRRIEIGAHEPHEPPGPARPFIGETHYIWP